MESKRVSENEFNSIQFEKRLANLKDSQESINTCCHWCLENRHHHKKIVNAWLNVLKRVKVEHRLTLFYLANDVIQYSKRKNYDFVESWGTTLQKATTMVRDERVKHKILRIFKIWEQRGIYNEEFISDLSGLISVSPRKGEESHEFQSSYLINKIRLCTKLETDTDTKLRKLKEHTVKCNLESESLISSLKDRAHVDDVEKELEDYIKHMENYVTSLKSEIKIRINLISLLTQTETQLETEWKDVKLVANAYKTFGGRVKTVKKKLDELLPTLTSPIPSPDVNAPSPSPDSDIDLPNNDSMTGNPLDTKSMTSTQPISFNEIPFTNAGYYNPVPPPSTESSNFLNNGFNSSFIGSNMPFNMQNFNPATIFGGQAPGLQNTLASSTALTQTTNSNINNNIPNLFPPLNQPPPPPEMVPQPANFQMPPATSGFTATSPTFSLLPTDAPKFPTTNFLTNTTDFAPITTNFSSTTNFPSTNSSFPPPPPSTSNFTPTTTNFQYGSTHMPLMPPPMPPFNKSDSEYESGSGYSDTYNTNTGNNYGNNSFEQSPYPSQQNYQPSVPSYPQSSATGYDVTDSFQQSGAYKSNPEQAAIYSAPDGANPYPPSEEYNPEEELDTWEPDASWMQASNLEPDTPESPPMFEKEGYNEPPIEYHDNAEHENGVDVDHRVLPMLQSSNVNTDSMHRGKDVDHRNLISLTGSPSDTNVNRPAWNAKDQDYRKPIKSKSGGADQDYRVPFNIEQLKLPPPPPPPKQFNLNQAQSSKQFNHNQAQSKKKIGVSPRKPLQDNVESIDMDLSDDELRGDEEVSNESTRDNLKVVVDHVNDNQISGSLEPPPPFPDLPEDVEANNFLDDLENEISSGEFTVALADGEPAGNNNVMWNSMCPPMNMCPPNMNMNMPPPLMGGPMNHSPNWIDKGFNQDFNGRGRGNVRGNFNNRGHRGGNEFRGRGRGRPYNRAGRGGPNNFRGNRGGPHVRGMRPPRGNFRGSFHNNF